MARFSLQGSSTSALACTIGSIDQFLLVGQADRVSACRYVGSDSVRCTSLVQRAFTDYCPIHLQMAKRAPPTARLDLAGSVPVPGSKSVSSLRTGRPALASAARRPPICSNRQGQLDRGNRPPSGSSVAAVPLARDTNNRSHSKHERDSDLSMATENDTRQGESQENSGYTSKKDAHQASFYHHHISWRAYAETLNGSHRQPLCMHSTALISMLFDAGAARRVPQTTAVCWSSQSGSVC